MARPVGEQVDLGAQHQFERAARVLVALPLDLVGHAAVALLERFQVFDQRSLAEYPRVVAAWLGILPVSPVRLHRVRA